MKKSILKLLAAGAMGMLALTLTVTSCSKEPLTESYIDEAALAEQSEFLLKAGNVTTPGRALAANCFQCHGTNGYAGELKIAGESSSGIVSELTEMKSKNPGSNIMNAHAAGYTAEQIKLIGDYFSKQ
jgi:sulfide dehydrogenase cytochrome subunit